VFSAALGNGPVNARREIIPNMDGWSQTIVVSNVDPMSISENASDANPNAHTTDFVRMEVIVHYQGPFDEAPVEMTRVSWLSRK
jgi:hypothetical protein